MKRVVFTWQANEDVADAALYYDARRAGLGDRFRDRVAEAVARLSAQPGIGSRVGRRAGRRLLLARFPFSLLYVNEAAVVRVVAVPHNRQRPSSWLRRLP